MTLRKRERVRGLKGGKNALAARQRLECSERIGVIRALVAHTAGVLEHAVLRSHARIVESGGDRMRRAHLAVLVLNEVAVRAVQHTRCAGVERGGLTVLGS